MARPSLGIIVGNRSIQVAEIRIATGSAQWVRAAEFQFGESDSLSDPTALGKKLGAFLKQHHFSHGPAVAGIPAQWLMLKEKLLPPASPHALAGMLRIQAERDFSMEPSSLAVDFIGGDESSDGKRAVLIAVLRERVERIKLLLRTAGLKVQSITPASLVLAEAMQLPRVLYFGNGGAELMLQSSHGLPLLKYICPASQISGCSGQAAILALAGEIRRAIALCQNAADSPELVIVDDLGIDQSVRKQLSAALETPIRVETKPLAAGMALNSNAAGCTALALCLAHPKFVQVDYLHSRLELKPPSKLTSRNILSAVAGFVLLLGLGWMLFDASQSAAEIADLQQKRDDMKEGRETAKTFIARMATTRTWYDKRPNYLECMRVITLAFPEEGRVWASNLSVREDLHGVLTGHAADEKSVLDVLDSLKSSPFLAEVKMLHMHGSGTKVTEISFSISFIYLGEGS